MKRYLQIKNSISSDGLGKPVISIYFSYCDKKEKTGSFCPNCQNPELQKDGVGYYLSAENVIKILSKKIKYLENLLNKQVGVCFLGGESLAKGNLVMTKEISKHFKDRYQIIYTWRKPDLIDKDYIKYMDKVVCGMYIDDLNNDDYILGSTNQVIINNKKKIIKKYKRSD